MKKILNERLNNVSAFLSPYDKFIDIGCDHALLCVSWCLKNKNAHVVASDINNLPLVKAKSNILKYHVEKQVIVRCGNGLETMDDTINTIVISGMGATNIVKILKDIDKYPNVYKLILSPNNDFAYLRSEISKLGFMITREKMVYENKKYYLISEFKKGNKKINPFYGMLDLKDSTVINYYFSIKEKSLSIINNIKDDLKKKELLEIVEEIDEKIKEL